MGADLSRLFQVLELTLAQHCRQVCSSDTISSSDTPNPLVTVEMSTYSLRVFQIFGLYIYFHVLNWFIFLLSKFELTRSYHFVSIWTIANIIEVYHDSST